MPEHHLISPEQRGAIEALLQGRNGDPFAILGPHRVSSGEQIVRAFLPGARNVQAISRNGVDKAASLELVHPDGLFAGPVGELPYRLHIEWPGAVQEVEDAYAFGPLLSDFDLHLLSEGNHREFFRCLGAQTMTVQGVPGVRFAVWAPNARRVSVVGNFNGWDGRRNPMRLRHAAGVWELFLSRLGPGEVYKYEILTADGHILLKADPVALATEPPPATASVVTDPKPHHWQDEPWMAARDAWQAADAPISIYEVHPGSWRRVPAEGFRNLRWDELAEQLVPYAADMGFTHIELLPVMEHPFGGSWGYQPLGLFAPTARYGRPDAFAHFVERCHAAGLGLILDWVPAHFPNDAHGLVRFDGTALYEHQDPREGVHQDWNTLIYNYGRNEVSAFLIGSALNWLERYHVDGLRVDAVASMLYRDYSRRADEWIPNIHGGCENLEAVAFLKRLNTVVRERSPGAMVIAEESTAWPGVSHAVEHGGLGFSYKWNMGWMHDTLRYMARDPIYRQYHHGDFTFGLIYAFSERFILPLSHDEVVYGKGSMLGRMRGDRWQRFANLRAYFGFMWAHPGKKLLFSGSEFAQEREWNHDAELDWGLLADPMHQGVRRLVRDLNSVYRAEPALHRFDCEPQGFAWAIGDDRANSVFAFFRFGEAEDAPVLAVSNMTPMPHYGYRIGVPCAGRWRELLNTDSRDYGGSGLGNAGGVEADHVPSHGQPASLVLTLPPLATLILRAEC